MNLPVPPLRLSPLNPSHLKGTSGLPGLPLVDYAFLGGNVGFKTLSSSADIIAFKSAISSRYLVAFNTRETLWAWDSGGALLTFSTLERETKVN